MRMTSPAAHDRPQRATAFAPASMANLGVGFDILGLAFEQPGDTVIAEWRAEPGVVIAAIAGDDGKLPREAEKNSAGVAALATLAAIGTPNGAVLTLHKGLPLGSGLGSSAASAVAAAVAVNALYGSPLSKAELLAPALEGEAIVSGYHADNIAPSLLGGITLVTGVTGDAIYKLPVPERLHLAVVTPDVAVLTREARAVLPAMIPLKAMVAQTAGVAQLIDALHRGDLAALGTAMERDGVIEPARAHLMPRLAEARAAARAAGALGLVISGAGPTLTAICDSGLAGERVAAAMGAVYREAGLGASWRCTRVDDEGARVVEVG